MNQLARDVLRGAWLRGQKQIYGELSDGKGGLCAMGVLGFIKGRSQKDLLAAYDMEKHETLLPCPLGCMNRGSLKLIAHLNDDHRCDFAKIAEIMP